MNVKTKHQDNREPTELRLVDFGEAEDFFEEDATESENFKLTLINRHRGYPHHCHRCETTTMILGNHPYCAGCNWDSLTDASQWELACAA